MDELAVMDGSQCILQLRGVRPFLSKKYDITKHPNYKYLSDADPKNAFNIEEFIACKLKVKENDQYETFEVDGDEDEPILQGNPDHPETETSGIEAEDDPFDYAALY